MSLDRFAAWLDATPLSEALKNAGLIIPLAQSLHILSVAFVFTGSVILTLRSFDLVGTPWSLAQWSRKLSGRLWLALGLLMTTGALLILAEPTRELVNRALQIKLVLVVAAAAFAAWLARREAATPAGARASLDVRVGGLFLLTLWVAIIVAGRWIAYA